MEAWEAAVVEGDAEVLEERERPAVEGAGLVLQPEELAEEVFRDPEAQRGGVNVGRLAEEGASDHVLDVGPHRILAAHERRLLELARVAREALLVEVDEGFEHVVRPGRIFGRAPRSRGAEGYRVRPQGHKVSLDMPHRRFLILPNVFRRQEHGQLAVLVFAQALPINDEGVRVGVHARDIPPA